MSETNDVKQEEVAAPAATGMSSAASSSSLPMFISSSDVNVSSFIKTCKFLSYQPIISVL